MTVTCPCGHELWSPTRTGAQAALTRHQRTCKTAKEKP